MSAEIINVSHQLMNEAEARACIAKIRDHIDGARPLIYDLHVRRGWEAIGYDSWRECVMAEFGLSQAYLYRQLKAAEIEREISPIGEKVGAIPEGTLRPLAKVPEGERGEVWREAVAETDNRPTAKAVEAVVERRAGRAKPDPSFSPIGEKPSPDSGSSVNGVMSADPPDVAKLRAAGKIPAGSVVEVHEPEPDAPKAAEAFEPGAGPDEDSTTGGEDMDLEALPIRASLGVKQLRMFDADATVYLMLDSHRKTFAFHATRLLNATKSRSGAYGRRLSRFLKCDHPKHWHLCPRPEDGGCNGTGEVPLIGECPKCFGRGYWIA